MMHHLEDQYGRSFKTLRVSLLNNCNLGCVYCTMGDEELKSNKAVKSAFSADDLFHTIQQLHSLIDFKVIRLTGGEPLLYSAILPLLKKIYGLGIPQIKLTTNGLLLERLAVPLKEAGMDSVNVSLDAVDEDVFFLMSRRNKVDKIVRGIDAAIATGMEVKLNAVLMKGINEQQIIPLLEFAFARGISIRFLEIMAMGHLVDKAARYLVSKDEILHIIARHYDFAPVRRKEHATANYWRTAEGHEFGVIANESTPFCHDCNRLRLDSEGNIYGCLSDSHPISLKEVRNEAMLRAKLFEALGQKQPLKFKGSTLSMLHIGG
jgi:cyclic pyranopterin phosphate synthase